MNGSKILMDTNALIAVLNGEAAIEQILQGRRLVVPVVACGEVVKW